MFVCVCVCFVLYRGRKSVSQEGKTLRKKNMQNHSFHSTNHDFLCRWCGFLPLQFTGFSTYSCAHTKEKWWHYLSLYKGETHWICDTQKTRGAFIQRLMTFAMSRSVWTQHYKSPKYQRSTFTWDEHTKTLDCAFLWLHFAAQCLLCKTTIGNNKLSPGTSYVQRDKAVFS